MIYCRRGEGIAINLYSASEAKLDFAGAHVRLRRETEFPSRRDVTLHVERSKPVAFDFTADCGGAAGAALTITRQPATTSVAPGSFAPLSRR